MTEQRALDFEALVAAARAQIPGYCPEWTDHNPSDPGITLVELAASFVEMLLFQAEQVTDASRLAFLRLLEGPAYELPAGEDLGRALDVAVCRLREVYRAVTPDDYALLIREQWPATPAALALGPAGRVARLHVLPERDLTRDDETAPAPGHVSVVVLPPGDGRRLDPPLALLAGLHAFLEQRRLLTVQTHVVGPTYVRLGVTARVYADDDIDEPVLDARVRAALAELFAPHAWPFGRPAFASEVLARLDAVPGVDFIEHLALVPADPARAILDGPDTIGVRLAAHELFDLDPALVQLTVFARAGGTWIPYSP